ncbi:hypothetical protein DAEQUDRAFT_812397 [Daedalea quercina L-15889]|uniref:F-box domain-containing protein n=1 Tax=Daedalea quercina L-15889 TaxID=1314783 RepID=A0A165PD03_9APHY|nr:hypothetical protein DAEQUDRAFT_812397 [Daedalea quercina L-15889]
MSQGLEPPGPNEIEIVYRLPTYASDAFPELAYELIEDISDFLWDEPVQLARCCLVCRAWYYAARRHLTSWLTIRSNNALRDLVHILMSKRNGKYGQFLRQLTITDDAQRAFAHTIPVRIPGCLLPSLGILQFFDLDWTTAVRPHESFFTSLTYFTSVIHLTLSGCHFHSADEFHRIINALPRLASLILYEVTIRYKQREQSRATPRHRLSRSKLTHLSVLRLQISGCPSEPIAHGELRLQQRPSFLELASYSTIVSLQLSMHDVSSFAQLQQFIRGFPALREVTLHHDPVWDFPEVSTETGLLRIDSSIDAWSKLALIRMSSAVMLRSLEFLLTQYRKVGRLNFMVLGLCSPALLQAAEEVMQDSGPALTEFQWSHYSAHDEHDVHFIEDSKDQIAPETIPRLTYNINLEDLGVHIVVLTVSRACTSLMTLLSHIESTHLRKLDMFLNLKCLPLDDMDLPVEGSTKSIAAFHAILCRPVFDGLPKDAADIFFVFRNNIEPFAKDVASAKIKAIMVPLLAPWLARGVLRLHLPDGSTVEDVDIGSAAPPIDDDSASDDGAVGGLTG